MLEDDIARVLIPEKELQARTKDLAEQISLYYSC